MKLRSIAPALAVGSLLLSGFIGTHANAQSREDVLCNRGVVGVSKYPKLTVPAGYSDVETYMLDSDFRRPKRDIPWSDTKILEDPVVGKRVGVLDRNYIPDSSRIHTAWYRDLITAVGLWYGGQTVGRFEFDVMMIPAGDSYLVLRGCNGRFPVTNEVAEVLRSQPKGKNIFVKLYAEGFGGGVLNQIGEKTVEQWKKIYADWSKSTEPRPDELGF